MSCCAHRTTGKTSPHGISVLSNGNGHETPNAHAKQRESSMNRVQSLTVRSRLPRTQTFRRTKWTNIPPLNPCLRPQDPVLASDLRWSKSQFLRLRVRVTETVSPKICNIFGSKISRAKLDQKTDLHHHFFRSHWEGLPRARFEFFVVLCSDAHDFFSQYNLHSKKR